MKGAFFVPTPRSRRGDNKIKRDNSDQIYGSVLSGKSGDQLMALAEKPEPFCRKEGASVKPLENVLCRQRHVSGCGAERFRHWDCRFPENKSPGPQNGPGRLPSWMKRGC